MKEQIQSLENIDNGNNSNNKSNHILNTCKRKQQYSTSSDRSSHRTFSIPYPQTTREKRTKLSKQRDIKQERHDTIAGSTDITTLAQVDIKLDKCHSKRRMLHPQDKLYVLNWYEANGKNKALTVRQFKNSFTHSQLRQWLTNRTKIVLAAKSEMKGKSKHNFALGVDGIEKTSKNGENKGDSNCISGDKTLVTAHSAINRIDNIHVTTKSSQQPAPSSPRAISSKVQRRKHFSACEKSQIIRWYETNKVSKEATVRHFNSQFDSSQLRRWISQKSRIIAKASLQKTVANLVSSTSSKP